MKIQTPLIDVLERYVSEEYYQLHTPGHKQGKFFCPGFRERMGQVLPFDLTEVPGLDDLHSPEGVIARSQEQAAALYGAYKTFYSVQGASTGIHAAIFALGSPGKDFIISRHAHRSVYAGMVLTGCIPRYLPPKIDRYWGIILGTDVDGAADIIAKSGAAPALITSPSYEGVVIPLAQLIALLRRQGSEIAVDEAHGAHFPFNSELPASALELKADIVIHGSHKTLPTLTQTAMIHANNEKTARRLAAFLDLLQTTSPSYILLAALDSAQAYLHERGHEDWAAAVQRAEDLRDFIRQVPVFELLEEEYIQEQGMAALDKTRIVFGARGISGFHLANLMREVKLQVELAGLRHVVMIITPGDTGDAVLLVKKRLQQVAERVKHEAKYEALLHSMAINLADAFDQPEVLLNPREVTFSSTREVSLQEAVGAVAAEPVIPYPPGIPLVAPGEKITGDVLEGILNLKKLGFKFQGPMDRKLKKIKIVD
ncbi:MAG: hypothetical protein H0Z35_12045 [Thermoanaerobacteraceae bacterium]|nr:hypothetical protein [Thermoanaerobacteraceae bacterium]